MTTTTTTTKMAEVFKYKKQITEDDEKAAYAAGSARYKQVADAYKVARAALDAASSAVAAAEEKAKSAGKRDAEWFSAVEVLGDAIDDEYSANIDFMAFWIWSDSDSE